MEEDPLCPGQVRDYTQAAELGDSLRLSMERGRIESVESKNLLGEDRVSR